MSARWIIPGFARFSLRRTGLLVTLICAGMALEVNRVARERRVVAQILVVGGIGYYRERWLPGRETLAPWIGDEYFKTLAGVEFGGLNHTMCGADFSLIAYPFDRDGDFKEDILESLAELNLEALSIQD